MPLPAFRTGGRDVTSGAFPGASSRKPMRILNNLQRLCASAGLHGLRGDNAVPPIDCINPNNAKLNGIRAHRSSVVHVVAVRS